MVERLNISEIAGQMSHGGARKNSKTERGTCTRRCYDPRPLVIAGPTPAIERLGIKPYQFGTECLSGDVGAGAATSFPQALGMV